MSNKWTRPLCWLVGHDGVFWCMHCGQKLKQ